MRTTRAHDYAAARIATQGTLDSGKATASDFNSFAWLGLFDSHLGEAELKAAQQSNMMSKNGSFADLHTLACVYAAEGHVTEARQVLDQAMYAGNQPEPNSAVWYALGLIYEQYGAKDAALAAYSKCRRMSWTITRISIRRRRTCWRRIGSRHFRCRRRAEGYRNLSNVSR